MERVSVGKYTVRKGDTPTDIAALIYGDRFKVRKVLDANPHAEYQEGEVIDLPDFTGVIVEAREGEQFPSLHRRAFNNPAAAKGALEEFKRWNGGARAVERGERVFFVDIRRKSYGY